MTEHELRALAPFVDLPDERELAPAVHARLRGRPQRRRTVLVVVAAALAAVAIAFAVPPARSAILRFFHLRGARIEYVDRLPDVRTAPLDLGVPVALADVGRTAGFRPLASDLLGRPDEVTWDGGLLWYRYGSTRLLVSQFRARERIDLVKKVVERDTMVIPVTVHGRARLLHHRWHAFPLLGAGRRRPGGTRPTRPPGLALAARAAHAQAGRRSHPGAGAPDRGLFSLIG